MIIVPLVLLAAVIYRIRQWDNPRTRPMTVALAALGVAITLRIPMLGDDQIDPQLGDTTGLANMSEWITESLVIIAAAGFLAWVMNACGIGHTTRWSTLYAIVGIAALTAAYLTTDASKVETDNLTALQGAEPYWGIFSAALGLSMAVVIYAATHAAKAAMNPRRRASYWMLVAAGAFGLAYCIHKIMYLLADSQLPFYMGTAWILVGSSLILFAAASFTATTGRKVSDEAPVRVH